jgi:hypothetical protein
MNSSLYERLLKSFAAKAGKLAEKRRQKNFVRPFRGERRLTKRQLFKISRSVD